MKKLAIISAAFVMAATASYADGDADKGEKVFKKCAACHSVEAGVNKSGPSLHGVIGRAAGSIEGFKYSDDMKNSGLTWDEATLTEFLKNPKGLVKKTKMSFAGLKKDQDIADVLAYLATQQ